MEVQVSDLLLDSDVEKYFLFNYDQYSLDESTFAKHCTEIRKIGYVEEELF